MVSVLIIDDNKPTADRIFNSLPWDEMDCHVVSIQYNGTAGKKAIVKFLPDLIITDIIMPGFNGLEVVEMTRTMIPKSKVIFISAYDYFEYAHRAIKLQAYDFLIKPFSQADLIKVVNNAVNELKSMKDNIECDANRVSSFMNRVLSYIELHAFESITLNDIAKHFTINATYLGRLIKQQTNKRYIDLITDLRIKKAIDLLHNTEYRIEEIAEMVGYKNYLTYYKVFTKRTGIAPSEYRKK